VVADGRRRRLQFDGADPGPGQQGLSQTVICKQAGASLIIVTGHLEGRGPHGGGKKLGADHVIDVQKENPLERIMQITGGKGVDVALDCTAGAGTIPILLGIEALKRKAGIIVAQGELREFPNFPLEKFTVKFITMKSARGHSYKACELPGADRIEAISAGADHDAQVRIEGRRPRYPLGRQRRRAGCDPRFADAMGVT
jgi:Threonine dehydrogenase and related Zn-dependent dehydrogenases